MDSSPFSKKVNLFLFIFIQLHFPPMCFGARKLTSLYTPPPLALTYHNGPLLEGNLPISILWYGKFSSSQKSIIVDFLLSLNPQKSLPTPTVSKWWQTVQVYLNKAGKKATRFELSGQVNDESCSLGKTLKKSDISKLAHRVNGNSAGSNLTLVLTAEDIAVEGFCMSNCGFHGPDSDSDSDPGTQSKSVFLWVGNSVTQCPGQCAWPFHQPIYGPQGAPLGAPNGDVGVDGMVVNIASLLASSVTNPFGSGYFFGSSEVASACAGVYGKGAYPGYAGELLVDGRTGGCYNAQGVNGRKYLLPALFDLTTKKCFTIV